MRAICSPTGHLAHPAAVAWPAALDALLGHVTDARTAVFTFVVRLENLLSPEQQAKLAAIRDKSTPVRP